MEGQRRGKSQGRWQGRRAFFDEWEGLTFVCRKTGKTSIINLQQTKRRLIKWSVERAPPFSVFPFYHPPPSHPHPMPSSAHRRPCNLRRVSLSEVFCFCVFAESALGIWQRNLCTVHGGSRKGAGVIAKWRSSRVGSVGAGARNENCHLPSSLVVITVIIVYTHAFSEWYIVLYSWLNYRVSQRSCAHLRRIILLAWIFFISYFSDLWNYLQRE